MLISFMSFPDNTFVVNNDDGFGLMTDHWLNIDDHHLFKFGLKACKDATIHMRAAVQSLSDNVQISFEEDKVVVIVFDTPSGSYLTYSFDVRVLLCDAFSFFWLSWNDNSIIMGQGFELFENTIFSVPYAETNQRLRTLHLVSVEGENTTDPEWQFSSHAGKDPAQC